MFPTSPKPPECCHIPSNTGYPGIFRTVCLIKTENDVSSQWGCYIDQLQQRGLEQRDFFEMGLAWPGIDHAKNGPSPDLRHQLCWWDPQDEVSKASGISSDFSGFHFQWLQENVWLIPSTPPALLPQSSSGISTTSLATCKDWDTCRKHVVLHSVGELCHPAYDLH